MKVRLLLCSLFLVLLTVKANTEGGNGTTTTEETHSEHEIANEHPFVEFKGLTDGSWTIFILIAVAASRIATIFPSLGLPLLTGYMVIGMVCGPYVLGMIHKYQVANLDYVTVMALAFIALSAGSELYLPEIQDLFKPIMYMSLILSAVMMFIVTLVIWGLASAGMVPDLGDQSSSCVSSVSSIGAAIMVSFSPASAIAIVRELRAKGPFTSTMLGLTVVADVVVLLLYTFTSSFGLAACSGGGFQKLTFLITILSLGAAIGLGFLMGKLIVFLLWVPRIPGEYTVLPLGFIVFLFADWFALWSLEKWGVSIDFDALFICIVAGYVVTNQSRNRHRFMVLLGKASPYIFVPFFTKVGIELNLPVLLKSVAFGFIVFSVRALCIFIGTASGGWLGKIPKDHYMFLWLAQITQAGVSIGLASRLAKSLPGIGPSFATTIISVILLGQIFGPISTKWVIKRVGEAGQALDDEMDEHGHGGGHGDKDDKSEKKEERKFKRALFVGFDGLALAVAQRLLDSHHPRASLSTSLSTAAHGHSHDGHEHGHEHGGDSNAQVAATAAALAGKLSKGEEQNWTILASDTQQPNIELVHRLRLKDSDSILYRGLHRHHSVSSKQDDHSAPASVSSTPASSSSSSSDSVSSTPSSEVAAAAGGDAAIQVEAEVIEVRRVEKRLISVTDDDSGDNNKPTTARRNMILLEALKSTFHDVSADNVDVVFCFLPTDKANFAAAKFFTNLGIQRVVARCFHPGWAELYACEGAVPVFAFSGQVALIHMLATCKSPSDSWLVDPIRSTSLAFGANALHQPADDTQFGLLHLSASEREQYFAEHAPPHDKRELIDSVSFDRIKLGASVPPALRDHYLQQMDKLHDWQLPSTTKREEQAQKTITDSWMGVNYHREEKKAAAENKVAENKAAENKDNKEQH